MFSFVTFTGVLEFPEDNDSISPKIEVASSSADNSKNSCDVFKEPPLPKRPKPSHVYEVVTRNVTEARSSDNNPNASLTHSEPTADPLVAKQAFINFICNLRQLKAATTGSESASFTSPRAPVFAQASHDSDGSGSTEAEEEEKKADDVMWSEFRKQVDDLKTSFQVKITCVQRKVTQHAAY